VSMEAGGRGTVHFGNCSPQEGLIRTMTAKVHTVLFVCKEWY
jgi:hypothetical protein